MDEMDEMDDMGHGTWDMGDMGHGTGTWSMGHGTWDRDMVMGICMQRGLRACRICAFHAARRCAPGDPAAAEALIDQSMERKCMLDVTAVLPAHHT
jgi:hypothetical protein